MSADPRLGPNTEELVARVLAELRSQGLLPPKPQVAPAPATQGPSQGPRKCAQRSRRKRIGAGPRAHQPRRRGELVQRGKRVRWVRG